MTDKQKLAKAQVRILALERELVNRSEEGSHARGLARALDADVKAAKESLEAADRDKFDIMSAMARQYKMTQDTLMDEVNALNAELVATQDELYLTRTALDETVAERNRMEAEKDAEIGRLKAQMEDMAASFAVMLSDTLDTISTRIHKAKDAYESHSAIPDRNKLLDFKLNQQQAASTSTASADRTRSVPPSSSSIMGGGGGSGGRFGTTSSSSHLAQQFQSSGLRHSFSHA